MPRIKCLVVKSHLVGPGQEPPLMLYTQTNKRGHKIVLLFYNISAQCAKTLSQEFYSWAVLFMLITFYLNKCIIITNERVPPPEQKNGGAASSYSLDSGGTLVHYRHLKNATSNCLDCSGSRGNYYL